MKKIRRHRHRFIREEPDGLIQLWRCRSRRCGFVFEQFLLFDLAPYKVAA